LHGVTPDLHDALKSSVKAGAVLRTLLARSNFCNGSNGASFGGDFFVEHRHCLDTDVDHDTLQ